VAEAQGGRLRRVDRLDPLDQALERPEAPLEHPQVHAQRQHDRHGEDQELPALVTHGQVETGREARREERERHEDDVRRNDLADERVVATRHPGSPY
jgi:hypothetical protein